MSFAISAEFPLGIYRGHVDEGELDIIPSPARLHAAFTNAASSGCRAIAHDGMLRPSPVDQSALEWLEANPPDELVVTPGKKETINAVTYRKMGLRGQKPKGKLDHDAVSYSAPIVWLWHDNPPSEIASALDELCSDVPYLGQADSLVRLTAHTDMTVPSTHRREPDIRKVPRRRTDLDLSAPRPGRTQALSAAFQIEQSTVFSRPKDKEEDRRKPVVTAALGTERYIAREDAPVMAPWSQCLILPIKDAPLLQPNQRTAIAVALRNAMLTSFNFDAPLVLTGKYQDGPVIPNHMAIQLIDAEMPLSFKLTSQQALVVALPSEVDARDADRIWHSALIAKHLYSRQLGGRISLDTSSHEFIAGNTFFHAKDDALTRLWNVLPAVSETRAQDEHWTLEDACLLSIGMVWRDQLTSSDWPHLTKREQYRELVYQAKQHGVRVYSVKQIHDTHIENYIHKTPERVMSIPYTAIIDLGDLERGVGPFIAIGQTRHLGGGLLVPCDIPKVVLDNWSFR